MTGAELGDIVNTLLALCPRYAPEFTPDVKRAWWLALGRYEYAAVMDNALRYARQKAFFPHVSDICPAEPVPQQREDKPTLAELERIKSYLRRFHDDQKDDP